MHPLDPLTPDEIRVAVEAAKSDARLTGAVFPSIAAQEPTKADVLAWQPGRTVIRRARVEAMTTNKIYELVVDLAGRRVLSAVERMGVEPSITMSEIEAVSVVLSNAEFKAGLE